MGLARTVGRGCDVLPKRHVLPDDTPTPQRFRQTYFTGSAGLKLVFGNGPVHGYLGSRLHWAPMKEEDTVALRDKARGALDALDASLSVPVSIGLRIRSS